MRLVTITLGTVLLAGCADAFTANVDVVARADQYELDVDRLATIVANGKGVPLNADAVKSLAATWIDYTLFAHSLVSGDSLLDSATVMQAKWADVQQEIASGFHAKLVEEATLLDSAQLDSVYRAGDYRLIKHVLFGVPPNALPAERAAQREAAERTRQRLLAGEISWAEAARLSDEAGAAQREGSLGVITRGQTVAPFEAVAFGLAPGEISPVTETAYGFHVIFRPSLAESDGEFRDALQAKLEEQFDDAYLEGLTSRWEIEVKPSAAAEIRDLARDPLGAMESRTVIGTYKGGGKFRVSDAARWLQGMPMSVWQRLPSAGDEQIEQMVESLIRNEVLLMEAKAAGIRVTAGAVDSLTDDLRRELALLGAAMELWIDSLDVWRQESPEARQAAVQEKPVEYMEAIVNQQRRVQLVPPFLAEMLRKRFDWDISSAGIERVLSRARALREQRLAPSSADSGGPTSNAP